MKNTTMLKKNYEFKYVLTKGKKYSGKYINIYTVKNNLNKNRLGIGISSKSANSVNRNKIKRLIRENYRLVEDKLLSGRNFVVLWKKDRKVEDANFYNIKEDFEKFINKEI